jgi:hypothetical protein
MGEGSEKEVWSSEGWPRYLEVLVVLHSFGAGGQAQTEVYFLTACAWE